MSECKVWNEIKHKRLIQPIQNAMKTLDIRYIKKKKSVPCIKPAVNVRSILSRRLCIDFKREFSDVTLFLTLEILAACCMIKGDGASSSSLSSSAGRSRTIKEQEKQSQKSQIKTVSLFRTPHLATWISVPNSPFNIEQCFPCIYMACNS